MRSWKITAISRAEATVIVHRHKPVSDNQMRLYWKPVYIEGGSEVLGTGHTPSTETIPVKRILFPVQLHDGVIAHAAARRLDQMGYRYDRSETQEVLESWPRGPSLEPAVGAVAASIMQTAADGKSFCSAV